MKFESRVGQRGQVVIPKGIRDTLHLDRNSTVEFELDGNVLTLKPKKDMRRFEEGIRRWKGALREQFLADGYTSTDEWIAEIRGR